MYGEIVFNLSRAFLLVNIPSLVSRLFKAPVTQALDQDPTTWRGFLASTKPALINQSLTVSSFQAREPLRLPTAFEPLH